MVYKSSSIAAGGGSAGTGGGTVSNITSSGGTITVTSPTGPITNVDIANNTANTLAGYDNSGVFSDVTIGTNLTLSGGVLNATGGGTGGSSVSSVFGRTGAISANYGDYSFNLIGGTASASQGGTGQNSLTAHSVLIGEGASAISFATTGTSGRLLIDQGNADPVFQPISGDAIVAATGALTLATVNSNVGTFGSASIVAIVTENAKGLTTAVSTASIAAPASLIIGSTLASNVTASSLTTVGALASGSLASGFTIVTAALGGTGANNNSSTGVSQWSNGAYSVSTGLFNGTTAVTQSASDNSNKIATDAYVTTAIANAIAGVNPAVSVVVATTAASDTSSLTYNNGVSGVGATFTGSNNTALTFDGVTLTSLNQRVLVKNDTQSPSGAFNGIYYLTQIQTAILPPILTRALDYNTPSNINSTGAIPVISGTVNTDTSWILTSTVNAIGTDALSYTQFTLNPTTIITSSTTAGGSLSGTYPNPIIASSAVSNSMLVNSSLIVKGVSGVTGGGSVALGSSITLGMANNVANTLAGYNSSTVFSDVSIGTNLNLISGVLSTSAFSAGSGVSITYSTNTLGISASGVSSVSNIDGSLSISPQTGNVQANLNTAHANTWTATQTGAISGGVVSFISQGCIEFSIFANGNSGAGTPNLKWDNGNIQTVTITGACTFGFVAPTHPGRLTVISTMSATTGFPYTYAGTILWPGGSIPTFSSISNAIDISSFLYDGSNYYGIANTAFAI